MRTLPTDNTPDRTVEEGARRIALLSREPDTQDDETLTPADSAEDTSYDEDDATSDIVALDDASDEAEDEDADEAEDHDAPDAEDDADADDSDDEDPSDTEEAPAKPRTFKVRLPDGDAEVDEPELIRGYQRQADYTRKTQALKQVYDAARVQRDQYAAGLQRLAATLGSTEPSREDWQRLRDDNPIEFSVRWAEHQQRQEQLRSVRAEHARVAEEHRQQEAYETQERLAAESRQLFAVLPEWKDEKVRTAEQQRLRAFGLSRGLSEDEVDNIEDHRAVLILRDAMRFHEMQAQQTKTKDAVKAKVAKDKPRVIPPGPSRPEGQSGKRTAYRQARQRLASSGRIEDAALAIEALG